MALEQFLSKETQGFFFWLLLKDRLSTRELLKRKNMAIPCVNCVLCNDSVEEDLVHLFLGHGFAKSMWNWLNLTYDERDGPLEIFETLRVQVHAPFFMEIIILLCWAIWQTRNDCIFKDLQPDLICCKRTFRNCFESVTNQTFKHDMEHT